RGDAGTRRGGWGDGGARVGRARIAVVGGAGGGAVEGGGGAAEFDGVFGGLDHTLQRRDRGVAGLIGADVEGQAREGLDGFEAGEDLGVGAEVDDVLGGEVEVRDHRLEVEVVGE